MEFRALQKWKNLKWRPDHVNLRFTSFTLGLTLA